MSDTPPTTDTNDDRNTATDTNDDQNTATEPSSKAPRLDRRGVLRGVGAAGLVGTLGVGPAAGRGNGPPPRGDRGRPDGDDNGRGPPQNGDDNGRGPPQKCTCPEGTFLAKYDFVDDEDCSFVLVEGEDVIDITAWSEAVEDACEPMAVSFQAPGYRIDSVCAFGGTDTDSVVPTADDAGSYDFEPSLTNPGGQSAAISNLTFCGEPTDETPACAALRIDYECTTYQSETQGGTVLGWRRQGTRFRVTNDGSADTDFGRAISNDVTTFGSIDSRQVDAGSTRSVVSDSSVPSRAIVFWAGDPSCADRPDIETWGEYKQRRGFADLDDFYDGNRPTGAPVDLDDSLFVAAAETIPANGAPDEEIAPSIYPAMSPTAETNGWITCANRSDR